MPKTADQTEFLFCFLKTHIICIMSLEKIFLNFPTRTEVVSPLCTILVTGEEIIADFTWSSGSGAAAPGDSG